VGCCVGNYRTTSTRERVNGAGCIPDDWPVPNARTLFIEYIYTQQVENLVRMGIFLEFGLMVEKLMRMSLKPILLTRN
jgi:hypothetical protein